MKAYGLVFLLCLIATRANILALSDVTVGLFICIAIIVFLKSKLSITRSTLFFVAGMLLLFAENYFFTVSSFDFKIYIKLLALCVSVICFIQLTQNSLPVLLKRIVVICCLVSLPFYLWQVLHVSSLTALGRSISDWMPWISLGRVHKDTEAINIVLYTIETTENYRNSGPFWEPGGFAGFLNLSLMLHLISNRFNFDRYAQLIILTLLTTFSTTGYVVLFILILFAVINRMIYQTRPALIAIRIFFLLALGLLFFYLFYALPIFRDKIDTQITAQQIIIGDIDFDNPNYKSLGRFGSMIVDLRSIKDKPLFGRGYSDTEFRNQYENYNFTNGLTSFMGHFGLAGLTWLLLSTYASGKSLFSKYNRQARFPAIITVIVLTIAFSNPILLTPFVLVFQLHFIATS